MLAAPGSITVVGIIGRPVAHSLSPLMHNRAFQHLGMNWVYVPFEVREQDLPAAVAGLRALSVKGVNVTIPHKTAVIPLLDELTPAAAAAGAVNTIIREAGRLIGDNTDGSGFVRSLAEEAGFDPKGTRVVVLGAGGAARAVAAALAGAGCAHVAVANRTVDKAWAVAEVAARCGAQAAALPLERRALEEALAGAQLLVQATPVGMAGDQSLPLDPDLLQPPLLVADLVYTPLWTPLLRAARARGCAVLPGWGMLLYQGAEAFERWTGVRAPVAVMREALLGALRVKTGEEPRAEE